jgi:hypothetical protein
MIGMGMILVWLAMFFAVVAAIATLVFGALRLLRKLSSN